MNSYSHFQTAFYPQASFVSLKSHSEQVFSELEELQAECSLKLVYFCSHSCCLLLFGFACSFSSLEERHH